MQGGFLTLFWQQKTKILGLSGPSARSSCLLWVFFTYHAVSRITCSLLQQQWGCTSWAWWGGPCMEYEVQENYPRICFSLPGMILCGRDFMLMNLDKYLPYVCQYNNFIGPAFTLTTFICQQILIARQFSWEYNSVSEFLTSFRIHSCLRTPFLFSFKKTRKTFLCNGWTTKVCI